MKIGFFYSQYYPLTHSGSVHGHYLFRALRKRGHTILSCSGENNPDTVQYPSNKLGALRLARDADVIYLRENIAFVDQRIGLLKFAKPFALPIVWEINAPVEQLSDLYPDDPGIEERIQRENRRRRFYARFADACSCLSTDLTEYAKNFLGIKRSYFIPLASDPEVFDPGQLLAENMLDDHAEYFKVGWVGKPHRPWSGIKLIYEAADKCWQIDKKILFVIVGPHQQGDLPRRENVVLVPEVPHQEVAQYILKFDVGLCLYSGFSNKKFPFYASPLKLFDYMSAARPIIASHMGQIGDIISDGENGYLTDNNIQDIVDKILVLKNNRDRAGKMGEAARTSVVNHYNWDRVAAQTEEIFSDLKGNKKAPADA